MVITKKTITSIFIMPTLKIPRNDLNKNDFLDAYLGDINKDEYHEEDVIFLLFRPKNLDIFREFLNQQYYENKQIIDDYDYEDGYVVLVYILDEKLKKDFNLIRKGKYSKTSIEFKTLFPKQVQLLNQKGQPWKDSLQWMIFRKDPRLTNYIENKIDSTLISENDLEIWPMFNEQKEVLDIEKIIKDEKNNTRH